MDNCIFCKIINGDIPSKLVYEDEFVYAFYDINPVAPTHVIIIPKEHIASAAVINSTNSICISNVFEALAIIARQLGLEEDGYRIVNNCGEKAGQTVFHIHFHLIGGRDLSWPPG